MVCICVSVNGRLLIFNCWFFNNNTSTASQRMWKFNAKLLQVWTIHRTIVSFQNNLQCYNTFPWQKKKIHRYFHWLELHEWNEEKFLLFDKPTHFSIPYTYFYAMAMGPFTCWRPMKRPRKVSENECNWNESLLKITKKKKTEWNEFIEIRLAVVNSNGCENFHESSRNIQQNTLDVEVGF